jgi:hypothetical protein
MTVIPATLAGMVAAALGVAVVNEGIYWIRSRGRKWSGSLTVILGLMVLALAVLAPLAAYVDDVTP